MQSGIFGIPISKPSWVRLTNSAPAQGSINTKTVLFGSVQSTSGFDVSGVNDSALGSFFQINTPGLYQFQVFIGSPGTDAWQLIKDMPAGATTTDTTVTRNFTGTSGTLASFLTTSTLYGYCAPVCYLNAGSRVYLCSNSGTNVNSAAYMDCIKIG